MTLTDTQLVLLSAASQREDGLLLKPDRLKGAAAAQMQKRLLDAGLVKRVPVDRDEPAWQVDVDESSVGLRLLPRALEVLGIDQPAAATPPVDEPVPEPPSPADSTHRPDAVATKRAVLIAALEVPSGVSVTELGQTLGWRLHSVRAALTRLRNAGYTVVRIAQRVADRDASPIAHDVWAQPHIDRRDSIAREIDCRLEELPPVVHECDEYDRCAADLGGQSSETVKAGLSRGVDNRVSVERYQPLARHQGVGIASDRCQGVCEVVLRVQSDRGHVRQYRYRLLDRPCISWNVAIAFCRPSSRVGGLGGGDWGHRSFRG